ncbi:TatD family hydrolase [Porphyromonadaceae bacterium OttesenSCG-928-L07]|nr:TatD family hydrolase [Porphyromonadaceae bacterium OttesenSCG-928-L07]MDL2251865.1 TatD family hydrolase [Odoribacter sp. OttesenSCG-928-J03]MDL2330554.1 TatD family hydrolase [Odoribacter sp. OttesenSCG-928-A06]
MQFVDTHSHLYSEEFDTDRADSISRAKEAGITHIMLPDIDMTSRVRMFETCEMFPEITFPAIGLHPTSVNENYHQELVAIERHLGDRKFYGIGECGLDFYWDTTYYKEQIKAFEHQLHIAKEMNLPVIIHSRESLNEILNILKKHPYTQGILHCFPGNSEEARLACEMGYLLGIGGVVTFKNSHLPEVVRNVGPEHIVLETDAPYLAPAPHRGKRNESAFIPLIAQKIAEITEEGIEKIAEITTQNAMKLFNFMP